MPQLKLRLLSWVIAVAALGFVYSSGASAALVLHGLDGGTTSGDGKFAWNTGKCVNTVSKAIVTCDSTAPGIGYLYKGPISGKFYRTGTCWSRSLNREVACSSASGFISSSFSHHGISITGGDLTLIPGEIDPSEQLMTVVPGNLTTKTVVTIDLPDISITGTGQNSEVCGDQDVPCFLGQGRFSYHVEYKIPAATSDPNKGGGNEKCGKCDPNNPAKGTACTGCSINQTCTASGNEAQFTVKAFCQADVEVNGYFTVLKGQPASNVKFTNCEQTTIDAGNCTLRIGGLPQTIVKGTLVVDDIACGQIFTEVELGGGKKLDNKQLLLFQQNYEGTVCNGTVPADFGLESPQGAKLGVHRECNSDYGNNNFDALDESFLHGEGFDNTFRGCVVATNTDGSPAYHVAQGGETAKSIEVTVDVTPESVNLKCSGGTDSGIATATICTTPEFNVTEVDINSLPVLFVEGTCPDGPCIVPPIPGGFSFAATSSGLCSGDFSQDLQITYRTCSAVGNGLAQRILQANQPISDGTQVPIMLQGTSGGGTVVIEGTDTVKVVKTQ